MTVIIYRSRCSLERAADGWHAALWTEYRFEARPAARRLSPAGWIHHRSAPVAVAIDSGFGRLGLSAGSLHYLAERGERHCRLMEGTEVAKRRDDGPTLFGGDEPAPATASAYPRAAAPRAPAAGGGGPSPGGPGPAAAPAPPPDRAAPRPPWEPPATDRAALRPVVAELAAEVLEPELAKYEERIMRYERYSEALATDRNRLQVAAAMAAALLRADQPAAALALLEAAGARTHAGLPDGPAPAGIPADVAARALEQLRAAIDGGDPARAVTARAILECALEDGGRAA